jgi:nucleotide-binding universal stress UspA family protein
MKSILLYANEDKGQEARLQAALDLARAYQGHITCIQVTPYQQYVVADPFGGVYAVPELIEQLNRKRDECRARLEDRLRSEGVCWSWVEANGHPAQALVDQSRLADVVVLTQPGMNGAAAHEALGTAGDTITHARAPVLTIPKASRSLDCLGRALVAWNGTPESGNALRAALPMLKSASAVTILTVVEEQSEFPATQAVDYLGWHGIKAELREIKQGNRDVSEAISDEAQQIGAAYVVMGGYGHSRFREAVLGGTTRSLLKQDEVPLLIGH